jgi:hypothetical protein
LEQGCKGEKKEPDGTAVETTAQERGLSTVAPIGRLGKVFRLSAKLASQLGPEKVL